MMKYSNSCPANSFTLFISLIYNLLIEKQPFTENLRKEYDFIIVGGGSSGCVIANRLSQVFSWNILLLEAGVEQPELSKVPVFTYFTHHNDKITWNYTTVPEPQTCGGLPCTYERGKMLGGSSSHNYMFYNRGNKNCYDRWSAFGNEGWSYDEVLEYFKKSEDNRDEDVAADTFHHSTGGELSIQRYRHYDQNIHNIMKALMEMGFPVVDYNGETQYGCSIGQYTIGNGERASTNTAFLHPVRRKRKNLHILTQATATRILICNHTKKAYGVELQPNVGPRIRVFATKEVILSAGAISSPQLLQLSGIGPPDLLKQFNIPIIKELEGVGRNFQDHPLLFIRLTFNEKYWTVFPQSYSDLVSELAYYQKYRRGPLSGINWPLAFWSSFENDGRIPDVLFSLGFGLTNCTEPDNGTLPLPFYNTMTIAVALVNPKSRGTVFISSSNPFTQPAIRLNFFSDRRDLNAFVDGVVFAIGVMNTEALKEMDLKLDPNAFPGCSHLEVGSRGFWRCAVWGSVTHSFHASGTCKMGSNTDSYAVVDSQLKVHGITGLRVVDTSIMPEIVNAHTNAAAIMIGEKGSDLVKKTWLF